jgi:hypothetical protein
MGINNNGQTTAVLESSLINITSPENSQISVGFYDQNNRRVQGSTGSFNELVIKGNTTKIYKAADATLGLAMLLDITTQDNQTKYSSLVADPLLIDSTFTRLFYLDGRDMKHFEKFSDMTDMTGSRIIVWKIKWDINETSN